jgi:hypothetical protein
MTKPQCWQVKVRVASDSLGFAVWQAEHVFDEGNQRLTSGLAAFRPSCR